ncbi:hypothetical protein P8C59_007722 [Phyllachora maydis]|uniref:Uncharacterized protein n=1 Tax=Phyllachora maydis TaxID=1825666 RepID=A0AAD9IAV4_9PEZI|nr:hypothetical protein P8C59_007722 [Phyllachora maydis]
MVPIDPTTEKKLEPPMSNLLHTNKTTGHDAHSGVTAAAQTVTSTLGNTLGGLTNTVGGVVGAAGRGVGETVNGATGGAGRPLGDGIGHVASGVEGAGQDVAQGVRKAGQWK